MSDGAAARPGHQERPRRPPRPAGRGTARHRRSRTARFARHRAGASPPSDAREVLDGRGLLAFPGLVDAHMHVGIYQPLADDAVTESQAAASGGVTTELTYFRTGEYYLNRGGPYREFFPEVLAAPRAATGSTTATTWRRSTAATSTRCRRCWTSSACRRSRSSCSTAGTGCTGAPTSSATS